MTQDPNRPNDTDFRGAGQYPVAGNSSFMNYVKGALGGVFGISIVYAILGMAPGVNSIPRAQQNLFSEERVYPGHIEAKLAEDGSTGNKMLVIEDKLTGVAQMVIRGANGLPQLSPFEVKVATYVPPKKPAE